MVRSLAWMAIAAANCSLAPRLAAADDTPSEKDEPAFKSIFDGKSLDGWEGDPKYWRVKDGVLLGEVTPDTLLKRNTFIIWRGGVVADFELKLEYRVSAQGNSGVGYRCAEIEGQPFLLRGYQADIEGGDNWTGINYEERGRAFLAMRGQKTIVEPGQRPRLVEQLDDSGRLQKLVKKEDWNQYHLIVRGNHMRHYLNGHLMSEVIDLDTANKRRAGLLGVQVHVGPPMTIEYRNIRLAHLEPDDDEAAKMIAADNDNLTLSPDEMAKLLTFDNPSGLEHLMKSMARLIAPAASQPISDAARITLKCKPSYVPHDLVAGSSDRAEADEEAGKQSDLVLIDGDRTVRVPLVPEKLTELDPAIAYDFDLRWAGDAKRYRITQVRRGDKAIYGAAD